MCHEQLGHGRIIVNFYGNPVRYLLRLSPDVYQEVVVPPGHALVGYSQAFHQIEHQVGDALTHLHTLS